MIENIKENHKFPNKKVDSSELTKDYESGARVLINIAEEVSKIPIPQETKENWKTLLASMRIVDDRLDNISNEQERFKLKEKIIKLLKGENISFSDDVYLEKASLDIIKLLSPLDSEQKKYFIHSISNFFEITEKLKIEKNSKEYIKLTRLEGQIAGRIFILFLPNEFKQSNNYKKLLHTLTKLGRLGNSFDSLIDFKSDYLNNQTKIKPNIFNKTLFLGAILTDAVSILKNGVFSNKVIKDMLYITNRHIKSTMKK